MAPYLVTVTQTKPSDRSDSTEPSQPSAAEEYGVQAPRKRMGEAGLSGLRREIAQEMAASLGRTGRRLEALIARLKELEDALNAAPDLRLESEFAVKRAEAFRQREHLKIQREALGLRQHDRVDEFYPIPKPRSE